MRTIRRKVPARVSVTYQCITCKTTYRSKHKAQECEKRVLEIKRFVVGETVRNIELRTCCSNLIVKNRNYHFEGTVINIVGPMPSDYEYECKWLGGKPDRINGHVYQYEVKYVCPVCNQLKTALYHALELKSLSVDKKFGPYSGLEKRY